MTGALPVSYWFQTVSGQIIDLDAPSTWVINIEDIAHALSNICRWGGHTRTFYSVAQHSVLVASCMPTPLLSMCGLLHDAAEAYVGDVISPLKDWARRDGFGAGLERRFHDAIASKFALDLGFQERANVKHADRVVLATELRDLCRPTNRAWEAMLPEPLPMVIEPWSPGEARTEFMRAFETIHARLLAPVGP